LVQTIPIATSFWLELEIAVQSKYVMRTLSTAAVVMLSTKYEQEYLHRVTNNENQKTLNHVCSQVFDALTYYINNPGDKLPCTFVAHQLLWDLETHFQDQHATYLLATKSSHTHIMTIDGLKDFVEHHYQRMYAWLQ
jgi:hypothetical protein